jgi:hypothetical protein
MSASKKTISLPKSLLHKAEQRAHELHYATFSDYLQELIRRDTMANNAGSGPDVMTDPSAPYNAKPDNPFFKKKQPA